MKDTQTCVNTQLFLPDAPQYAWRAEAAQCSHIYHRLILIHCCTCTDRIPSVSLRNNSGIIPIIASTCVSRTGSIYWWRHLCRGLLSLSERRETGGVGMRASWMVSVLYFPWLISMSVVYYLFISLCYFLMIHVILGSDSTGSKPEEGLVVHAPVWRSHFASTLTEVVCKVKSEWVFPPRAFFMGMLLVSSF